MKLTFWGTRGSISSSLASTEFYVKAKRLLMNATDIDLEDEQAVDEYLLSRPVPEAMTFGGNTPCVEVQHDGRRLILDCGSGLFQLGRHMMSTGFSGGKRIDILQSHTHWDHINGFPFFQPAFTNDTDIHIHGIHPNLKARFEQQMDRIHFPITLDDMTASLTFDQEQSGEAFSVPGFEVESMGLHHPGGSYAYKIKAGGQTIVYATDGEYKGTSDEVYEPFVEFYRDADLLIFDAMYSTMEKVIEKENYGHSTPVIGIRLALSAGVKNLALFHHDPECNDNQIARTYDNAREYLRLRGSEMRDNPLELIITYDGLEMDI